MTTASQREIRVQRAHEWPEVRALIDRAFAPASNAGQLADWVRDSSGWIPELSIVADRGGRLVGHVLLSQLPLRTSTGDVAVLCLSPLSVDPPSQGQGIARALVGHAMTIAGTRPEPFVVLEGDPRLYRRFGFVPAAGLGIQRPSELVPESAFQLRTLPGYDPQLRGQVEYPAYFYEIGAVGP